MAQASTSLRNPAPPDLYWDFIDLTEEVVSSQESCPTVPRKHAQNVGSTAANGTNLVSAGPKRNVKVYSKPPNLLPIQQETKPNLKLTGEKIIVQEQSILTPVNGNLPGVTKTYGKRIQPEAIKPQVVGNTFTASDSGTTVTTLTRIKETDIILTPSPPEIRQKKFPIGDNPGGVCSDDDDVILVTETKPKTARSELPQKVNIKGMATLTPLTKQATNKTDANDIRKLYLMKKAKEMMQDEARKLADNNNQVEKAEIQVPQTKVKDKTGERQQIVIQDVYTVTEGSKKPQANDNDVICLSDEETHVPPQKQKTTTPAPQKLTQKSNLVQKSASNNRAPANLNKTGSSASLGEVVETTLAVESITSYPNVDANKAVCFVLYPLDSESGNSVFSPRKAGQVNQVLALVPRNSELAPVSNLKLVNRDGQAQTESASSAKNPPDLVQRISNGQFKMVPIQVEDPSVTKRSTSSKKEVIETARIVPFQKEAPIRPNILIKRQASLTKPVYRVNHVIYKSPEEVQKPAKYPTGNDPGSSDGTSTARLRQDPLEPKDPSVPVHVKKNSPVRTYSGKKEETFVFKRPVAIAPKHPIRAKEFEIRQPCTIRPVDIADIINQGKVPEVEGRCLYPKFPVDDGFFKGFAPRELKISSCYRDLTTILRQEQKRVRILKKSMKKRYESNFISCSSNTAYFLPENGEKPEDETKEVEDLTTISEVISQVHKEVSEMKRSAQRRIQRKPKHDFASRNQALKLIKQGLEMMKKWSLETGEPPMKTQDEGSVTIPKKRGRKPRNNNEPVKICRTKKPGEAKVDSEILFVEKVRQRRKNMRAEKPDETGRAGGKRARKRAVDTKPAANDDDDLLVVKRVDIIKKTNTVKRARRK